MKNNTTYFQKPNWSLLLACIALWIFTASVQAQAPFLQIYGSTDSEETGTFVRQLPNGGFQILGTNDPASSTNSNYVIWTDDQGQLTDSQLLGPASLQFLPTDDGGYVKLENGPTRLIRTDANGNEIWTQTYTVDPPYSLRAVSFSMASDGGFIISGGKLPPAPSSDGLVIRTDSNGNQLWQSSFAFFRSFASSAIESSDGAIVVRGQVTPAVGATFPIIRKLDNTGSMLWEYTLPGYTLASGYDIAETPDGGIVFVGSGRQPVPPFQNVFFVGKLATNGTQLWLQEYPEAQGIDGRAIIATPGNGLVISGTLDNAIALLRTDSGGNILWRKTYGPAQGFGMATALLQTSDGGFAATGRINEPAGLFDIFLLKTDGDGNIGIDLELDIQSSTNNQVPFETIVFTVTITNAGSVPASGVIVHAPKPDGGVYTGGNEYSSSQGTFNPYGDQMWNVGTLAAGASATLDVNFYVLQSNPPLTAYAQVTAANENDQDSTPGNGTPPTPNEDDEAVVIVGRQPILLATQNNAPPSGASFSEARIFGVDASGNTEMISNTLAAVNSNTTNFNGNAYDPLSGRFYFSRFDGAFQTSELFFNDLKGNQQSAGQLGAAAACGTFYNGAYYYVAQLSDDFFKVTFHPDGTIASEMQVANIFDGTAYDGNWLGFGDIAFSLDGTTVYGSATRTGVDPTITVFFKMNADGSGYTEICGGPACGFQAGTTQIAFGSDGKLYGANTLGNQEFYEINSLNGNSVWLANLDQSFSDLSMGTAPLKAPDLWLGNLQAPASGQVGSIVSFNFDLNNTGNAIAEGAYLIEHYLSVDPVFDSGDVLVGEVPTGNTPVGTISQVPASIFIPAGTATGNYYLLLVADADNDIAEFSENNNLLSQPFEVTDGIVICQGDIFLTSQAEVNAFNCTQVTGDLYIGNTPASDIYDLSPLSGLSSVGGFLVIENNPSLPNLSGLNSLTSVGRWMFIENNDGLTNLDGLSSLQSVAGSMSIRDNAALVQLNGLSALTTVGEGFFMEQNAALIDVSGLSSLVSVGATLAFINNASLPEIKGLSSLVSTGTGLWIEDNDNLVSFGGFSSLTSIGNDDLSIRLNPSLLDFEVFPMLNAIAASVRIENNNLLENLDGLATLTSVGNNLWIFGNASLTDCCGIYPLLSTNGVGGNVNLFSNPSFCSSEAEILTHCAPGAGIDLELSISGPPAFTIYQSFDLTVTIANTGGETASGIQVHFAEPMGTVFVGGNEYTASQGTFSPYGDQQWNVGSIAPGGVAFIEFHLFPLQSSPITIYSEVVAANENDNDSTPGNGTPPIPNEDDEAAVTLNAASTRLGGPLAEEPSQFRPLVIHSIFPVPATDELNVLLSTLEEQEFTAAIYDIRGQQVAAFELDLAAGFHQRDFDISALPDGMYVIRFETGSWHEPVRFIKKRL